jgi:nucleotide-binding universal stress UspA family protein
MLHRGGSGEHIMHATASRPFIAVVGFDFSESAELAFDHCLALASQHEQAEIHVVHVVPVAVLATPPHMPSASLALRAESLDDAAERLRKAVDTVLARFRAEHGTLRCRVVSHLRVDHTAAAIAQLTADLEADLLVVGTHGTRGVWRWLLGSVAQSVVALAPCPVLVVRPKHLEVPSPVIEPPCSRCLEARRASHGQEFWCAQHGERHGRRHTYHQGDRTSTDSNFPLVVR